MYLLRSLYIMASKANVKTIMQFDTNSNFLNIFKNYEYFYLKFNLCFFIIIYLYDINILVCWAKMEELLIMKNTATFSSLVYPKNENMWHMYGHWNNIL